MRSNLPPAHIPLFLLVVFCRKYGPLVQLAPGFLKQHSKTAKCMNYLQPPTRAFWVFGWMRMPPFRYVIKVLNPSPLLLRRAFAIHQILFAFKTCKYCYETDELPNPKANPTQQKLGYKWHLSHFFSRKIFFCGLGLI